MQQQRAHHHPQAQCPPQPQSADEQTTMRSMEPAREQPVCSLRFGCCIVKRQRMRTSATGSDIRSKTDSTTAASKTNRLSRRLPSFNACQQTHTKHKIICACTDVTHLRKHRSDAAPVPRAGHAHDAHAEQDGFSSAGEQQQHHRSTPCFARIFTTGSSVTSGIVLQQGGNGRPSPRHEQQWGANSDAEYVTQG